jgi:DNA ligase-1
MVFDIMYLNGEALLDKPLDRRIATMMDAVQGTDVLQAERGEVLDDPARLETRFEDALERGLEGLVVKRVDSPYQAGARNFNWVKLKKHSRGALEDTIDVVMLGYFLGRGKRAELGSALLLVGVYDADADEFVTVTKIEPPGRRVARGWRTSRATSLDERPARTLDDHAQRLGRTEDRSEVLADEITKSPNRIAGQALRFRVICFATRTSVPEDATTLLELVQLSAQPGRNLD